MNNPTITGKLASSPLKADLVNIKDDKAMISEAFLGILARTPTPQEAVRYEYFMKGITNRNEAIDDLMWVLVNSAEFSTKR